jgi:conjugal transfer pilus assembly protein TraB
MPAGFPPPGAGLPFEPPAPTLMRVSVSDAAKGPRSASANAGGKQDGAPVLEGSFLPVSATRGILLGGLDAPTGGQSQSNPQPVLIRLSDTSILPNRFRADYRECFVIGAGYGDISSERAYLRTESLSCVRSDGTAIEVKIQGSVYGEDGHLGVRGRLVTKQGQMLANALMAGIVSGIGQGISTANTSYSTSAFGSVATTTGADALKAGVGTGVGKALDRLAQYYIKLAEQTFPVIEVDAGREIDVVITRGARIDADDLAKASPAGSLRGGGDADRTQKGNNDEE